MFFSYEHFYVLYCKFWELDSDHDFIISKEELKEYGGYRILPIIFDRIFSGFTRTLMSQTPNTMTFQDFVWFCISEEDKTSPTSLEYWFKCVDLDGDGGIGLFDIEHFVNLQLEVMKQDGTELIPFKHIFSQLYVF